MKRIMRAFKMDEISAVDRPAQVHARMSIMKRDTSNEPGDGDMTKEEIAKMIADSVTTATADLSKKLDDANAIAKMSDAEKAYMDKLSPADKMKFMGMSSEERKAKMGAAAPAAKRDEETINKFAGPEFEAAVTAEIAKRSSNEETLVVGGETIRKSEVGEAVFKAMKAGEERVAKAENERDMVTFTKRAEDELSALPGEAVAKAKVLKSINSLPTEDQTALNAMLKAGQAALKSLTKSKGHDGGASVDGDSAEAKLAKMVDEHAEKHKINKAAAYTAVLATEEGSKLYDQDRTEKRAA